MSDDDGDSSAAAVSVGDRARIWIYITLIILRVVVSPFLPGYIHPDEFFQGGQELWFGCPPMVPWEFDPRHALRSVVPPTILSRFPILVYAWVRGIPARELSGQEILILPRIFCAVLSLLCVDRTVWLLSKTKRSGETPSTQVTTRRGQQVPPIPALILSSAWPVWTLLSRPFSNSMEAFILSLSFGVVLIQKPGKVQSISVGALFGLGLFTRFTFIFFALPIGFMYLWQQITFHAQSKISRFSIVISIFLAVLAFLFTTAAVVWADSTYYSTDGAAAWENLVLSPLNAFNYNSITDNLKDHGLHPRWTHVIVNMMLLFGPLTLASYFSIVPLSAGKGTGGSSDAIVFKATLLTGLGFLSLAPHQEPRFLLPLILPVTLLGANSLTTPSRVSVWIAFNTILLIVFGILHQGGIAPSLLMIPSIHNTTAELPEAVVFCRTYMPPTFLSRGSHETGLCKIQDDGEQQGACSVSDESCSDIPILDLAGADIEHVRNALESTLLCSNDTSAGLDRFVYVVMPTLAANDEGWFFRDQCYLPGFECNEVFAYWPHLTTEDLPPFDGTVSAFISSLSLHTYKVRCNSREDS